ncbi:MAG: sugar transferase [Agarilytica sp.]
MNTLSQMKILHDEICHDRVLRLKRVLDVFISAVALALLLPLFPIIALAIKIDSRGPIFFKQMRIGLCMPMQTHVFQMIKFRTMVVDAEGKTGAVWAQKNDCRITRVGKVLRKTRLDELPQLVNVIMGDMSLIGPRPERPGFYNKLEDAIPYFAERTYGVLPGVTGLAQINQGYDTCIEDVRSKLGYDLSYALALTNPMSWAKMDLQIFWRTITVMLMGRGQ